MPKPKNSLILNYYIHLKQQIIIIVVNSKHNNWLYGNIYFKFKQSWNFSKFCEKTQEYNKAKLLKKN